MKVKPTTHALSRKAGACQHSLWRSLAMNGPVHRRPTFPWAVKPHYLRASSHQSALSISSNPSARRSSMPRARTYVYTSTVSTHTMVFPAHCSHLVPTSRQPVIKRATRATKEHNPDPLPFKSMHCTALLRHGAVLILAWLDGCLCTGNTAQQVYDLGNNYAGVARVMLPVGVAAGTRMVITCPPPLCCSVSAFFATLSFVWGSFRSCVVLHTDIVKCWKCRSN